MNLLRSLLFLALASFAHAQFAPLFTNATLGGSGTKVPSGGTLTVQSGGNLTIASGATFTFTSGTIVGTLGLANGGTGGTTAATARTSLGLGSIATLSSVSLTSNVTGVLPGANGGTGVANTGKSTTLGGNFTTSGAYDLTITLTGATGVQFPTTGTLATLAGAESLTNKKLGSLTSNGVVHTSSGDGTLSIATVTVGEGGTGLTAGTSGGIPYFSSTSAVSSSALLTANRIVVGGGAGAAPTVLGSSGTTTTVLHGNATGLPAYSAVDLASSGDITGTLAFGHGGTGQTAYTNGQLLIGNTTSGGLDKATLTAGANITITNAAGSITIASSGGGGGGSGNVTGPVSSTDTNIVTWNGTAGTSVLNGSGLTAVSGTITSTSGNATVVSTSGNVVLTAASGAYTSINGNSTGGPYLKVSRVGGYDYYIGVDTGSTPAWILYDNDASTKLIKKKSTQGMDVYVTTSGQHIVHGSSSGPFMAMSRASDGYFYWWGIDGSNNLAFYDNDASTVLFGTTQSTGNFRVLNSLTFPTSGKGIVGTATNDSANAGVVGEYVSSLIASGSAVSLSNATAANVTSISLTAGDWDVSGIVNFAETTATVSARTAGISTTSATLPTDGSEGYCGVQSTVTSETNSITLARKRVTISGTTTVYLVGQATFSAGTAAGFGTINARRVR